MDRKFAPGNRDGTSANNGNMGFFTAAPNVPPDIDRDLVQGWVPMGRGSQTAHLLGMNDGKDTEGGILLEQKTWTPFSTLQWPSSETQPQNNFQQQQQQQQEDASVAELAGLSASEWLQKDDSDFRRDADLACRIAYQREIARAMQVLDDEILRAAPSAQKSSFNLVQQQDVANTSFEVLTKMWLGFVRTMVWLNNRDKWRRAFLSNARLLAYWQSGTREQRVRLLNLLRIDPNLQEVLLRTPELQLVAPQNTGSGSSALNPMFPSWLADRDPLRPVLDHMSLARMGAQVGSWQTRTLQRAPDPNAPQYLQKLVESFANDDMYQPIREPDGKGLLPSPICSSSSSSSSSSSNMAKETEEDEEDEQDEDVIDEYGNVDRRPLLQTSKYEGSLTPSYMRPVALTRQQRQMINKDKEGEQAARMDTSEYEEDEVDREQQELLWKQTQIQNLQEEQRRLDAQLSGLPPLPDQTRRAQRIRMEQVALLSKQQHFTAELVLPRRADMTRARHDEVPTRGMLVNWETGTGKTRLGIQILRRLLDQVRVAPLNPYRHALILVPPKLVSRWQQDLERYGADLGFQIDKTALVSSSKSSNNCESTTVVMRVYSTTASPNNETGDSQFAPAFTLVLHTMDAPLPSAWRARWQREAEAALQTLLTVAGVNAPNTSNADNENEVEGEVDMPSATTSNSQTQTQQLGEEQKAVVFADNLFDEGNWGRASESKRVDDKKRSGRRPKQWRLPAIPTQGALSARLQAEGLSGASVLSAQLVQEWQRGIAAAKQVDVYIPPYCFVIVDEAHNLVPSVGKKNDGAVSARTATAATASIAAPSALADSTTTTSSIPGAIPTNEEVLQDADTQAYGPWFPTTTTTATSQVSEDNTLPLPNKNARVFGPARPPQFNQNSNFYNIGGRRRGRRRAKQQQQPQPFPNTNTTFTANANANPNANAATKKRGWQRAQKQKQPAIQQKATKLSTSSALRIVGRENQQMIARLAWANELCQEESTRCALLTATPSSDDEQVTDVMRLVTLTHGILRPSTVVMPMLRPPWYPIFLRETHTPATWIALMAYRKAEPRLFYQELLGPHQYRLAMAQLNPRSSATSPKTQGKPQQRQRPMLFALNRGVVYEWMGRVFSFMTLKHDRATYPQPLGHKDFVAALRAQMRSRGISVPVFPVRVKDARGNVQTRMEAPKNGVLQWNSALKRLEFADDQRMPPFRDLIVLVPRKRRLTESQSRRPQTGLTWTGQPGDATPPKLDAIFRCVLLEDRERHFIWAGARYFPDFGSGVREWLTSPVRANNWLVINLPVFLDFIKYSNSQYVLQLKQDADSDTAKKKCVDLDEVAKRLARVFVEEKDFEHLIEKKRGTAWMNKNPLVVLFGCRWRSQANTAKDLTQALGLSVDGEAGDKFMWTFMLEIWNHPRVIEKGLATVLLGDEGTAEGVDLMATRRVLLASVPASRAKYEQVASRAFRMCSLAHKTPVRGSNLPANWKVQVITFVDTHAQPAITYPATSSSLAPYSVYGTPFAPQEPVLVRGQPRNQKQERLVPTAEEQAMWRVATNTQSLYQQFMLTVQKMAVDCPYMGEFASGQHGATCFVREENENQVGGIREVNQFNNEYIKLARRPPRPPSPNDQSNRLLMYLQSCIHNRTGAIMVHMSAADALAAGNYAQSRIWQLVTSNNLSLALQQRQLRPKTTDVFGLPDFDGASAALLIALTKRFEYMYGVREEVQIRKQKGLEFKDTWSLQSTRTPDINAAGSHPSLSSMSVIPPFLRQTLQVALLAGVLPLYSPRGTAIHTPLQQMETLFSWVDLLKTEQEKLDVFRILQVWAASAMRSPRFYSRNDADNKSMEFKLRMLGVLGDALYRRNMAQSALAWDDVPQHWLMRIRANTRLDSDPILLKQLNQIITNGLNRRSEVIENWRRQYQPAAKFDAFMKNKAVSQYIPQFMQNMSFADFESIWLNHAVRKLNLPPEFYRPM